jgi:hypothetical protein
MNNVPADRPEIPTGPYGSAIRIAIPDIREAAQTVDFWVITSPGWSPAWEQFLLGVVRLDDDVPGFPAPVRHFEGATHEQLLVALNPDGGPYDADKIATYFQAPPVPFLEPVNHINQFTATDDEMRDMSWFAVWGVLQGVLPLEPNGDRDREAWLTSMTKTIAHIRGEAHAR